MNRRSYLKASAAVGGCLLLPAGVLALVGRSGAVQPDDLRGFNGNIMGTSYSVRIGTATKPGSAPTHQFMHTLAKKVHQELLHVDKLMSTWRSDSGVSLFNTSSDLDWQTVSPETLAVVTDASYITEISHGSFDITIGPLVDLWGFGASASHAAGRTNNGKPAVRDIVEKLNQVGHTLVEIDPAAGAIRKRAPEVRIDLSGIAKGYAVDRVASLLNREDVDSYLIEVGGELRSRGRKPDGSVWKVAIERPAYGQRNVFRVFELDTHAVATSGNYRNFFMQGGQQYSHAIDPRTGQSVSHALASVSVVAETTMRADAVSTAMMIMGPDKALEFAEQHAIAAHLILNSGKALKEMYSPAFAQLLT